MLVAVGAGPCDARNGGTRVHVRKARVRLAALWLLLPSAVAAAPAEVRLPPGALQYGRCDAPVPRIHGQSDQAFSRRLIAWRGLHPNWREHRRARLRSDRPVASV